MGNDKQMIAVYKDRSIRLNHRLAEKQEANVDRVIELHIQRMFLEHSMSKTSNKIDLKILAKLWTENQFSLQDAWNFDRDSNYHKPWTCPKCTCPSMDNDDRYPYGMIVSSDCPLHGE